MNLFTAIKILVDRKDDDNETIIVTIFERYCVSINKKYIFRSDCRRRQARVVKIGIRDCSL